MKSLKTAAMICLQNLRKWQTDYRVWTIAVLMIIMVQIYVDDMQKISTGLGTDMPIWIFPFLYSQFHTKLIFTFPLILLFCNAPFTDDNQIFVYLRSGKIKWLCGQILYIVSASALYYIFLFIVSLISTIFYGEGNLTEWGKTLVTVANSGAAMDFGSPFIEVSARVIDCFYPLQAVWFTFLMSWLCGIVIGLIVFLCNYLTGTRFLGIAISSALLVLSVPVKRKLWDIQYFSPVSWNTLDGIDVGETTECPSFTYCLCVYLILMAVLIAAIFIFGRRKSLDIKGG
jgi:hypothetical protein